jgi:zinc protease
MRALGLVVLLGALGGAAEADKPPKIEPEAAGAKQWTLANRLRVVYVPDHKSPVVSVQVFYHVGSKDEPADKRGIAHMFEHMMFKGSKNVRPEQHHRFISAVGGKDNAFTDEDMTGYDANIPPSALDVTLELEAERMRNLLLTQETIDSERQVVLEELRLRADNPIITTRAAAIELAFRTHPYRHDAIGEKKMLDTVTVADCQKFYDAYYQPNNALLVIVGDVGERTVRDLVDQRFGAIPAGAEPPRPSLAKVEPAQTEARESTLTKSVASPLVVGEYHIPGGSSDDLLPLHILSALFSGGDSTPLNRRLVLKDHLSTLVGGGPMQREDPALFNVFAYVSPGVDAKKTKSALEEEIARVGEQPVSEQALAMAKRMVAIMAAHQRERVADLATTIGNDWITARDPLRVFSLEKRLAAVTAADVQRVARKYLVPSNSSYVILEPLHGRAGAPPETPSPPATAAVAKPSVAVDPWAERTDLFVPSTAVLSTRVDLGRTQRYTLSNGLRVIAVVRSGTPLVNVTLAVRAGALRAPEAQAGVASFTSELLARGTVKRSADQIAAAIDATGGSLDSWSDDRASSVACNGSARDLGICLDLVSDVAVHPSFPETELAAERDKLISSIESTGNSAESLVTPHARNLYFGDGDPRGRFASKRSVAAIDRAALLAFHDAWYKPNNSILVVSGDFDPTALHRSLAKWFGGWKRGRLPSLPALALPAIGPRRLRVVDKPDATQAHIRIVGPGIAHGDTDLCATTLMNHVLGGGLFTSRLAKAVREDGKSYSVGSSYKLSREPGLFVAGTFTRDAEIANTLHIVLDELDKMKQHGPTDAELVAAKANLIGGYGLALETGSDVAKKLLDAELDELPADYVEKLPACYQAVTQPQAAAAAAAHIVPQGLAIVGNAKSIVPILGAAKLAPTEIVAADEAVTRLGK